MTDRGDRKITKVLIVDGQGGGLGRQLVSALRGEEGIEITAVGTNSDRGLPQRRHHPGRGGDSDGGRVSRGDHAGDGGSDRAEQCAEDPDPHEPLRDHRCRMYRAVHCPVRGRSRNAGPAAIAFLT